MARLTSNDRELVRCQVILLAMLAMLGLLLVVLWRIQVAQNPRYENRLIKQSVRQVRWPGERGRIFDRSGVCLADNRPSFCVSLYLEELRQPGKWENTVAEADRVIASLASVLQMEPQVTREDIRKHIKTRLPLPLIAWRDVDQNALARLSESDISSAAVDIYVEPVRVYPHGGLASHLLGYVGQADAKPDPEHMFDFYLPEWCGKAGLEKRFNDLLGGEAGGYLIRVDARGFRYDKFFEKAPVSGHDLMLTIDAGIQEQAEAALAGQTGAVVVVDCRNGDVLAMASSPSYDPNNFVPAISRDDWQSLTNDLGNPLLNRAINATYPPGSAFKPVVAIAALETGRATADTEFECRGYFEIGQARLKCWNHYGHGTLKLRKAIEQSCNCYFAALGLQCGYDAIYRFAEAAGLGQKTGIECDPEASGLLPDAAWKRRHFHEGWRDGDTCNAAIGQGALLTTPLQMAMVIAAIANGGHLYRPRLVLGTREAGTNAFALAAPLEVRNLNWSESTLRIVRGGMRDVIEEPTGTGQRARIPGVEMAGKTGTAEYGPKGEDKKRGWMVVFAPVDNPRYAVAMVTDSADSGGLTVAPRIKRLMQGIFGVGQGEG